MQTSLLLGKSCLQNSLQFGWVQFAEAKKNHPKVAAAARRGLLAPKLGQRVLKRLDQALHILGRHLNPVGRDTRALRVLGRVLQADERLAVHDAGADAGELEGEGRGHGDMVAQKRKPPEGGFTLALCGR